MKNLNLTLLALLFMILSNFSFSQISKTDTLNKESAKKWFEGITWSKGRAIDPSSTINVLEFAKQYYKNKVYWDKAFEFLNSPELAELKPGEYTIDSTFVFAMISYADSYDSSKVKWEAHRKYLDLQYLISGSLLYAMAPYKKEEVSEPYNDSIDIERVITNSGKYYKAAPGSLFVFFPSDAHKSVKEHERDIVKRVVIKVIYTR
ncbi:MAG: YhcH/YjgK/YiaL family protein [Ignavibacteriaceae bacterium]|nr:YhcH/YjgK/YiaL family protein [Ignavibacteriaceae bacterium]